MKVNINVKSDKAKIKYYDIESISEFLSKIKGSIRNKAITEHGDWPDCNHGWWNRNGALQIRTNNWKDFNMIIE